MHILCEHSLKSIKGLHLQCVFRALSIIANVEHLNEMTMILSELTKLHSYGASTFKCKIHCHLKQKIYVIFAFNKCIQSNYSVILFFL